MEIQKDTITKNNYAFKIFDLSLQKAAIIF